MASPIGYSTTSVSLATLAEIQALASKGPLVDLTRFGSTKRHSIVLQLHCKTNTNIAESQIFMTKRKWYELIIWNHFHGPNQLKAVIDALLLSGGEGRVNVTISPLFYAYWWLNQNMIMKQNCCSGRSIKIIQLKKSCL